MFIKKIKELSDTTKLNVDSNFLYKNKIDNFKYNLPSINFKIIEHVKFDINQAVEELNYLKKNIGFKNYPIKNNKTRYYYKGISLTSFKDQEDELSGSFHIYNKNKEKIENEQYVGLQKESVIADLNPEIENDFKFTNACTPFFQTVLSHFKAPITRVRILELKPGGIIPPHIDYPYTYGIKLHAYLETNSDVWCEVAGERFQIPADGKFVWMDISKPHSVINLGKTSRYSLCINFNPLSNEKFKYRQLEDILNEL